MTTSAIADALAEFITGPYRRTRRLHHLAWLFLGTVVIYFPFCLVAVPYEMAKQLLAAKKGR
jgi:hypothetical protein